MATTTAGVKASTRKLFGTDGVRGVANQDPMTPEVAMRLGRAVAHHFARNGHHGRIVIGKDTRLSGYMFESALASGLCSAGADVMICGPLPTPGIAFITSSMRADAGVVISASHNPYQDNGIKIFARDGFKLPDDVESELERLVAGEDMEQHPVAAEAVGRARRIEDSVGRYVVFLKSIFPRERTLDGLKVVVDCANGAAYKVAPAVLEELGAEVFALSCKPDGKNINRECGALHPEHVCKSVPWHDAHIGIALDGDADRVIISDERGQVVDGDAIMAMLSRHMLRSGELREKTLVATIMSNLGLERALTAAGGKLVRTAVGDRYVVEEMRRAGYNFGGEQSGHLIFLDHATTGDGIVAALKVLALMVETGRPLSELASGMTRYPQVLLNVRVAEKRPLESLTGIQKLIVQVEQKLGQEGRVLVRYSGTEPKVRVMVEGADEQVITAYAKEIAAAFEQACAT